jgi:hypothetical protein
MPGTQVLLAWHEDCSILAPPPIQRGPYLLLQCLQHLPFFTSTLYQLDILTSVDHLYFKSRDFQAFAQTTGRRMLHGSSRTRPLKQKPYPRPPGRWEKAGLPVLLSTVAQSSNANCALILHQPTS